MRILFLTAHCDDETIGAGGLIPKLIKAGHDVSIILGSDSDLFRSENINNGSAFRQACERYGITNIASLGLQDQRFDEVSFVDLAGKVGKLMDDPDFIISHSVRDLNRDHRIMAEVAKLMGRPKQKPISILAMEITGNGPWNAEHFQPNLYFDISDTFAAKMEILNVYKNEVRDFPNPTSLKGIEVMAQFRGMESGSTHAEAYEVIRLHGEHLGILEAL